MPGSYRELRAWRQAVELALEVYRLTENFPRSELYGLTTQIRRSAISVPSNMAEGKGRFSDREFGLFLLHARGSLWNGKHKLFVAGKLGYLNAKVAESLARDTEQLAKTLNALLNGVSGKSDRGQDRKEPTYVG